MPVEVTAHIPATLNAGDLRCEKTCKTLRRILLRRRGLEPRPAARGLMHAKSGLSKSESTMKSGESILFEVLAVA
jgi:hypothetical protein